MAEKSWFSRLKSMFGSKKRIKVGPHEWMDLEEWNRDLTSKKGLFKKVDGCEKLVIGPHLTKNYDAIVGDADTIEDFIFLKHASEEQKQFFKKLWHGNRTVARQYLFAIIGATPIWTKDIKMFQHTLSLLRTGEVMLKEEEDEVMKIKVQENLCKNLPMALMRHFPEILGNIKKDYNELDDLLADLEMALRKFSHREAMIEDHLNRLGATHPFLFESEN